MKVLVTGGAGFIGSHTVDFLLSQGLSVRVLDNLSSGFLHNLPIGNEGLEFVLGSILDSTIVDRCMNEITHVIHLAAQVSVPVSVEKPVESGSINVAGFMNVLDSARRHNVAKFVYASSAAVYGVPMILPLTEKSNTVPISPYGLEKLINDQYANLYNSLYGISSIGMRYFNVYGDRQDPASSYSGVISRFIDAAVKGKVITVYGDGLQTRDFIHVSDIAKVNFAALQSSAIGVLNVATGSSVTLLELVSSIEDSLGRKLQIKFSEAREGDIKKSITDTANLQSMLKIGEMTTISQGLKQLIAPAIVDLRKS